MNTTTVHTPSQVMQSAQATIDRIVRESPLHILTESIPTDDTHTVDDSCDDVNFVDNDSLYPDREAFAFMRIYHPRYTVDVQRKPTYEVAMQIWADMQKDVSYYAGIVGTYLRVFYTLAYVRVHAYVAEQRAHIQECLCRFRAYLREHHERIEARALDVSSVSQYHAAIEAPLPVVESRRVVSYVVPTTSKHVAPFQEEIRTTSNARSALTELAPLLVYVRAIAIVMSRIVMGYSHTHRVHGQVDASALTHEQYTDIIDTGTSSEISRRLCPATYE